MHPLKVAQPWPYEQWWVAACSGEVGRSLLGRTILNQPMIFYRKEDGEAVALHGVCPHRSFPLAKSCLEGDTVRCGYHGFAFAASGECVEMPSQASVPKGTGTIRRYPVVERGGLVWIWTGRAETADSSLIPDVESHGLCEGWAIGWNEPVTVKCRYVLLIDNLMDLTHATYIHADTLPGSAAVVQVPPDIIDTDRSYNVQRLMRGIPASDYSRMQFQGFDGAVDRHIDAEYFGPAIIRTGGSVYAHDSGERLGTQNFFHLITPATETSVHYNVVSARDFSHDDARLAEFLKAAGPKGAVASQDVEALQEVEIMLQSLDGPPGEISCRADTGALKVRHRLEAQIRAEMKRREQLSASTVARAA